jgi:hypothetical protein
MKKTLSVILIAALLIPVLLSFASAGFSERVRLATPYADALNSLGLFTGTGQGYELERAPTRAEGLIMLLRLLGLYETAASYTGSHPFTDVPDWVAPRVAYARSNHITTGTSLTTFGTDEPMSASHYLTFVLRALGYRDGVDFPDWTQTHGLAESIGLINAGQYRGSEPFLRADVVVISYNALGATLNGTDTTLIMRFGGSIPPLVDPLPPPPSPQPSPIDPANSVTYSRVTVAGTTVDVIRADLNNPRVRVRAVAPAGRLNNPTPFRTIVEARNPIAAVNGNFFNSNAAIQDPVGNLMSDGNFLYASAGITSMGITDDNQIFFGRPGIFTHFVDQDGSGARRVATEINVRAQGGPYQSVLYTPARGASIAVTHAGAAMTVRNDTVTEYRAVSPGDNLPIPADGYVVFFNTGVISTSYFAPPKVGVQVAVEYEVFSEREGEFAGQMHRVRQIVSGAPVLVRNGAIDTSPLEAGFTDASRFGPTASAARTAVGRTSDNKLIIVSATATIPKLKEIMFELGCVDAINIDGGASRGMYADGRFIHTPGRNLTSVLLITGD